MTAPIILLTCLLLVRPAWAHGTGDSGGSVESVIVLCCVLTLFLYLLGFARAWRRRTRSASVWRAASFVCGCCLLLLVVLRVTLRAAEASFAFHMAEHELLMIGVAPLFIMARPLGSFAWALPDSGRWLLAAVAASAAVRALTLPVVAWVLQAAALWAWHMPVPFEAALANPGLHALQHASFLVTALLFWWSLFHGGSGTVRHGAALLSLFTTVLHTGLLGALLAVSPIVWYSGPGNTPLFTLEDQQLAGIIMWIPGGILYIAAALWIAADWLRMAERRTSHWERAPEASHRVA
jgi:putative membrane protein